MIAHAIEMKYPKLAEKNLHGAQIAVTSLTAARLQKNLLMLGSTAELKFLRSSTLRVKDDEFVVKFFGKKIAQECQKEYEQKLAEISKAKKPNWLKLKKELQKIHLDESHLKEIFSHFKIKTTPRSLGLSNQQYQACVEYAKFTRNRFTCLDLEFFS